MFKEIKMLPKKIKKISGTCNAMVANGNIKRI